MNRLEKKNKDLKAINRAMKGVMYDMQDGLHALITDQEKKRDWLVKKGYSTDSVDYLIEQLKALRDSGRAKWTGLRLDKQKDLPERLDNYGD